MLQQRESILDATQAFAQEIVTASADHNLVKAEFQDKANMTELEHLQEANIALMDRIKSEKDVSEKELEQVQSSYQQKFV